MNTKQGWLEKSLTTVVDRRSFMKQLAGAGAAVLAVTQFAPFSVAKTLVKGSDSHKFEGSADFSVVDTLAVKDFSHLLGGKIEGLSDKQLQEHFGLYKNYVDKMNMLNQKLKAVSDEQITASNGVYSEYRTMIIERAFAHNGIMLHEQYFANLGQSDPSPELKKLLARDFGTFEGFLKQFYALGKAMRGWAILGYDMIDGKLRTYGLDHHHEWAPVMVYPILVLDVYEHAYMIDYGTARAKYLDVFMTHIDWQAVHKRLMYAVHHLHSGPSVTA